jgi:hypothetical protein
MLEIKTSQFEFAHGRRPRGVGQWFFKFGYLKTGKPGSLVFRDVSAPPLLSYGEAKKWARAKAAELGAFHIEVCS